VQSKKAGAAKPAQRIIKKYPNRRLYDTDTSTYITLAEVKQLVMDSEPFVVRDAKSNEDLTRSILLQIILEEEGTSKRTCRCSPTCRQKAGEQSKGVTPEMWAQFMNMQNPMMQNMMGTYMEQSRTVHSHKMQEQMQKQTEQMLGAIGFQR
jgi:polyhydroxyalkanoate synthesis regulator protein